MTEMRSRRAIALVVDLVLFTFVWMIAVGAVMNLADHLLGYGAWLAVALAGLAVWITGLVRYRRLSTVGKRLLHVPTER